MWKPSNCIELPSMFDHVEGCAPDILCTRISPPLSLSHFGFTSLDQAGCASGCIGACIPCGSCRRWGIQALSVVNTRVIIVAGHLGPQTRHIRSLTIQSLRSELRLINNSETMREHLSPPLKIQLERWTVVNDALQCPSFTLFDHFPGFQWY